MGGIFLRGEAELAKWVVPVFPMVHSIFACDIAADSLTTCLGCLAYGYPMDSVKGSRR